MDADRGPKYAFRNGSSFWVNDHGDQAPRVWFKWSYPLRFEIAKIGFSNVFAERANKRFDVVGAIDRDCVDWQVLLKVEDAGFVGEDKYELHYFVIPHRSRKMYSCVGIKPLSMNEKESNGRPFMIRNIGLWSELKLIN